MEEVFRTDKGCVFQCNHSRQLALEFNGVLTYLKINSFFDLKKTLDHIDVNLMINQTASAYDLEIITPLQSERCYVLTLCEIIHLKELLTGAKVMLELNSILHERLYCLAV